jgi:hypothetical protein
MKGSRENNARSRNMVLVEDENDIGVSNNVSNNSLVEMEAAFDILDMLYLNPKEEDIYRRRWLLFLEEKGKEVAPNEGQKKVLYDLLKELTRYKFDTIPTKVSCMIG